MRAFKFIPTMLELLRPQGRPCPFCGRSTRGSLSRSSITPNLLTVQLASAVCGACIEQIPWIEGIRCVQCGRSSNCEDCQRRTNPSIISNRSAVNYNSFMRSLLAAYKYRGDEKLEPLLGNMLIPAYTRLSRELAQWHPAANKRTADLWSAVTYVPLSREREEERGFNQAQRLAAQLAGRYDLPLLPLLSRTRHTEKMSLKSRSQRIHNMKGLFALRDEAADLVSELVRRRTACPVRLLLVDDIYTTGSTLHACAEIITEAFSRQAIEIYGLTWARS